MDCLVQMQKRPKIIDMIEKFQLSAAYPVLFAILCLISGLGNKRVYLPIISLLVLFVIFSILFVRDVRVFIVPIFMIYYSLGTDTPSAFSASNGNVIAAFDKDGFVGICILAAVVVPLFLIRFIKEGAFTLAFKEKSVTLYGIIALNIAIMIGGAFSPYWSPKELFYALSLVAGLDVFYLVMYYIVRRSGASVISYACKVLVLTSLVIATQICFVVLRNYLNGTLIFRYNSNSRWILLRENLCLSWGISNIICASCAAGIPASLYLAKNERHPYLYCVSAIVMWLISILINTRSAMLVGGFMLCVGLITISFVGKNKWKNLAFLISFIIVGTISVLFLYDNLSNILGSEELFSKISKFLRFDSVNDRIKAFRIGIQDFQDHFVFGVGWTKGVNSSPSAPLNFYSKMYHCIVIQMGASAGIVGLVALGFHAKDILYLSFKRACIDRLLLLSVPLIILLMSLVDNFFFYLNIQIFYVTFLCLAEEHLKPNKKDYSSRL